METTIIDKDISILYVTADSFPEGIMPSHQKLHSIVPFSTSRKYFGVSRPEAPNGKIVYRAAAEQLSNDEPTNFHLETLLLKKGNYISIKLTDYMSSPQRIADAFQLLLEQPGLDPNGYCVEWYLSQKEVICMIRLEK